MNDQDYVTKRQFVIGGAIVGAGIAVALAVIFVLGYLLLDYSKSEVGHNHERIRHEVEINRRQARLLKELRAITHPTKAQADRQLREGVKRCLSLPRCRKLFPNLAGSAGTAGTHSRSLGTPTPARPTGATSAPPETPQSAGPTPSRPDRRPAPPAKPEPNPSSGTSSGTPPPPPIHDPPVVGVSAPVPVHVCAGKLLEVNC
jgi:cell division septation protein DedD